MPKFPAARSACALGVALWALWPASVQHAAACLTDRPTPFVIDASLQAEDRDPPAPFGELTAFTRRVTNTRCVDNVCTQVSCYEAAKLELHFDAPSAGHEELGFRVIWLRGHMPEELRATLDDVQALANPDNIALELSWNGVTELDGELALVAVDHAGNESAPTRPVHVEWSGCTSYWDDPSCGAASEVEGSAGCSVAAPPGQGGLPLTAAALAAAILLCRATRRKNRRANPATFGYSPGHVEAQHVFRRKSAEHRLRAAGSQADRRCDRSR